MNKWVVVLIAIVSTHLLTRPAAGQWVPVTPQYSDDVWALTSIGTTIFAGMDDGVYLSTNNGSSWRASGLTGSTVRALLVTGGRIFAGTDSGVFVSTNNSVSWSGVGLDSVSVDAFCTIGRRLIAGTRGLGIFVSTDAGSTWNSTALGKCTVYSLASGGSEVFATVAYGGVFVSNDSGETWVTANNGLTTANVNQILVSGMDLYVSAYRGVFRSTNGGALWKSVLDLGSPRETQLVSSLAISNGNIVVGSLFGEPILYSTDDGAVWNSAEGLGSSNPPDVECLAVLDSGVFAGTRQAGVLRSFDNGESWTPVGLADFGVTSLVSSGSDIFEGSDGGGIFRSTDNGNTWNGASSGLTSSYISCLVADDSTLFSGTQNADGGGVFRSTDFGSSWSLTGLSDQSIFALALRGQNLLAGTYTGAYLSTNNGDYWNTILGGYYSIEVQAIAAGDTDFFASDGSRGIYISGDDGVTWAYHEGVMGDFLVVSGARVFLGSWTFGLQVSTDNGSTWSSILSGYSGDGGVTAMAVNETKIYAKLVSNAGSGGRLGVFLSDDLGARWTRVDSGLTDDVNCLCVSNGYLFAGASNGRVWRRLLSEMVVGVKDREKMLPNTMALSQNYPNPFNPTTVIAYQLPAAGRVSLIIYDVLGREVARLVDGQKAAGSYEVKFDGSKLPSGLYFYRLSTGSYSRTMKMVVLK
ncbi:MAG TPA: T9SS type A sorting domain-containing protein [Candidatus Kryptonia bacterium]